MKYVASVRRGFYHICSGCLISYAAVLTTSHCAYKIGHLGIILENETEYSVFIAKTEFQITKITFYQGYHRTHSVRSSGCDLATITVGVLISFLSYTMITIIISNLNFKISQISSIYKRVIQNNFFSIGQRPSPPPPYLRGTQKNKILLVKIWILTSAPPPPPRNSKNGPKLLTAKSAILLLLIWFSFIF